MCSATTSSRNTLAGRGTDSRIVSVPFFCAAAAPSVASSLRQTPPAGNAVAASTSMAPAAVMCRSSAVAVVRSPRAQKPKRRTLSVAVRLAARQYKDHFNGGS